MPSSYPLYSDVPRSLCQHCGMVLPKNLYCTNCGYYNNSVQTDISVQETQPSPSFSTLPKDFTSQSTQKLNQYNKRLQSVSSSPSQDPNIHAQNMSSVTPFLGISPNVYAQSTSSVTPFLGISPNVPFQPPLSPQDPNVYAQSTSSVTPFLGVTPQPNPSQVEVKHSSSNESLYPSSSYSTQPTLIIPVEVQKEQKRSSKDASPQQIFQHKKRNKKFLLGIMLSIFVLVGGGLAGYLFIHSSVTQKSTKVAATLSSSQSKESLKFVDIFKNNSNRWDLQSEAGKYSVAIADGKLVLEDDNNSLLPELLPGNRSFNNFKMIADAVLSKGDARNGYGFYIRCLSDQNGNPTMYYRFELYGDGTYAIFKGILDQHGKASPSPLKLVSYTTNNVIQKQGSSNHVEINAQGSETTIRVNGHLLKTFTDPSYTKGTVALFISNIQNAPPGAQAKFSNLTIYPL